MRKTSLRRVLLVAYRRRVVAQECLRQGELSGSCSCSGGARGAGSGSDQWGCETGPRDGFGLGGGLVVGGLQLGLVLI